MSLAAGTRIGVYEIVSALGAGGMGEVYRARDTKLNRDVAIKVLLPAVANDPDRLARFSREAQVLASLNHPNIAHVHGLEESGGVTALVMELVEGEDLSQRIARGPIPLDEGLPIARQIAEALEAAHDHGIIHRDLKPANIKVRADGTVKVLDFGLAKAIEPASGSSMTAANSPTLSIHATQAGIILGTAAYMSPEQARGKFVDKRTDIWAFGAVLFEMLTGARAFPGDDATDTIVAVISKDPDWNALPSTTSPSIRKLLRRCLEKDPKRRLDSAAAIRLEIDEALNNPAAEVPAPRHSLTSWWLRLLPWAVAAAAMIVAGTLWWRGQDSQPLTPIYVSLEAPPDTVLGEDDFLASLPTRTPMVFTPDGKSLIIQAARSGNPQLYIRSLDRPDARLIAGTDDARGPFVSPDGRWVGFWTANELKKVPLEGGLATTITALPAALGPFGASWGPNDVIVFGDQASGGLMRISANGGTPAPITTVPSYLSFRQHVSPAFLPDGERVLFSEVALDDATQSRIMIQRLSGGDAKEVVASASDGRLLPSGHLVFMRLGTLMSVAFSVERGEVTGEPAPMIAEVMQSGLRARFGAEHTGAGMFAVSSLGTLAAVKGPLTGPGKSPLTWVARDGTSVHAEPASGAPAGGRQRTRISPDGLRALVGIQTPTRIELWFADWARNVWTHCGDCADADDGSGTWSPDGRRLLVSTNDASNGTLVAITIDRSQPKQVMVREEGRRLEARAWLADGSVLYESSPDPTQSEIKVLETGASSGRVIVPLGEGADSAVSPDGRWLAYIIGRQLARDPGALVATNVVVEAFPGRGRRTQVSAGGGRNPTWSADGRTLYYLSPTQAGQTGSVVFAADINVVADVIRVGSPRELLRRQDGQGCVNRCYDISPDGRFLFRDRAAAKRESVTRMDLVLNWTSTLPRNP
jgi:serine/threonine protein kinase/Tol biopolymer transport system component